MYNMDKNSFQDIISNIPLIRESFQETKSKYNIDIIKDVLAITYKPETGDYEFTYNMVTRQGKVLSCGYQIDLPFTIPEALREKAMSKANTPIAFHETIW